MSDRYKVMGLEMLPTKRYMVRSEHGTPGKAWLYRGDKGFGAVCFDDIDVLCSGGGDSFNKYTDWDLANRIQGLANACARLDLSIPEALGHIRGILGEPLVEIELSNVDDPGGNELVAAVEAMQ